MQIATSYKVVVLIASTDPYLRIEAYQKTEQFSRKVNPILVAVYPQPGSKLARTSEGWNGAKS